MAAVDFTANGHIVPRDWLSLSVSFIALYFLYIFATHIYSAFLGPLSKIAGPKWNALSDIPLMRYTAKGTDNTVVPKLFKDYGPMVRVAPNFVMFAGDAETWKEVHGFKASGNGGFTKDMMFYGHPINGVAGLITADNPTHARQRKIVSHAFSDRALKEQEPLLHRWATMLKDKLLEKVSNNEAINMVFMLNCTTFDVMADLTFAEPLYMLQDSVYVPWVKTIFASLKKGTILRSIRFWSSSMDWIVKKLTMSLPSVAKKQREHMRYVEERVDRRLATTPPRPDLWSRILEKSNGPEALSLKEHYTNASTFMLAGTETTATALSGTIYHLLQNPQYMSKLKEELRSEFHSINDLHLDPLQRHKYLDAVLHEGLRMYPPVPTGLARVVPQGGAIVQGQFLPGGTRVAIHQLSTYRAESNFRDPWEFHPERWLGDEKYANDHLDALEPFSVGPRNCIGKNLAWHEMRLLLATVLIHFDLELCSESQDWANQRVYTLWEKPPLMCKLHPTKIAMESGATNAA